MNMRQTGRGTFAFRWDFKDPFVAAALLLLAIAYGCGVPHRDSRENDGTPSAAAEVKSNDACYVCHMPFLEEPLAQAHEEEAVWCGTCHGPSSAHIADEDIGATPPDRVYKKEEIEPMCGKCHEPEKHPEVTGEIRSARLAAGEKAQRGIKGREIQVTGVCTDCHGRHWIPPLE